jgi:hypothetical protein
VLFPIALMVAAMVWVWTSTDLFSDSEAFCGPSVDSRFQLAYALFLIYCAVFFVSLAVRMRAVADRFFIKKEIKFSVLVVFVLELAAALLGGLRSEEDEKQTPLSRVASILSTYALLSVAVAYPLYRSYVNPPGFKMSALAPSMSLEDFEGVLGDKETRQAFRLFLVQSLCPENLMFWEEVEKYRAGFDLLNKRGVPLKARLAWARTHSRIIYRNYIGSRAAVEVNLSAPAINEVNEFFSRYRQREWRRASERACVRVLTWLARSRNGERYRGAAAQLPRTLRRGAARGVPAHARRPLPAFPRVRPLPRHPSPPPRLRGRGRRAARQ